MIQTSLRRSFALLGALCSLILAMNNGLAADFLDPEQAFRLSGEMGRDGSVVLKWDIAKGYKLYRDRIKVSVESGDASIKDPVLPKGIDFVDPSTGEKMAIYHDHLVATVPVSKAGGPFRIDVQFQGCADDGLCYPPIDKVLSVDPGKQGNLVRSDPSGSSAQSASAGLISSKPAPAASETAGGDDLSLATSMLQGGSLWKIALAFLMFGLLLSFTPCVLPMVPILSSIIVGEGDSSRGKSFLMAVAYCLGMALVYTTLGVAAGLAGEGLAGALQKPWVLVMFALLLVGLSLSMFDVYQLQVPSALQNRLNQTSGNLKGGRFIGVFFMGSISALIIGPCVAAPLAGTLVYISQTKDVLIGGLALFSMAMGMSVPLLLIGLSAGSLLPKAGAWMIGVKYVFGFLLIGVAIWMVTPVLPPQVVLLCWGSLAILCSVFSGVFGPMPEKATIGAKFTRALGLMLLLCGAIELVGAASGSANPLAPLSGVHSSPGPGAVGEQKLQFRRIHTLQELDRELKASGKPVMLDFYADWCVSCKEMEKFTFSDAKVLEKLSGMTLLQVDVTGNTEEDRKLMKRFDLFGPPGIVFFDRNGREVAGSRIVGFVEAPNFLSRLKAID
ncbi:MAG: protein-disulfide reductase DsbD [Chlorobiaceae bacterium]|nr:protein-disulfide reductase DsbD [Chlorobiaceae bacterium]